MTEPLLPFQRTSETSREAAIHTMPQANTLRRRVLDYLHQRGPQGATDDEIQRDLEMNPSTQRPRRVELERGGWCQRIDAKRRTRSGRLAYVYVATTPNKGR